MVIIHPPGLALCRRSRLNSNVGQLETRMAEAPIEIPTLKVEEVHRTLADSIRSLVAQSEGINVLRPIHAATQIRSVAQRKRDIQAQYNQAISDILARTAKPVSGPGFAMGMAQSWSLALGLTTFFRLTSDWNHLGAVVDRKTAFAVASSSVYVALISLIATTTFGWLSLSAYPATPRISEAAAQPVARDAPQAARP